MLRFGILLPGLVLAVLGSAPKITAAQEFRVYTRVSNLASGENAKPTVQSRSLTLFHAGKVYDYVDAAQEVILFEPGRSRFTILNENRQLQTEISQDEIRRFLDLAENEATKLIRDFQKEPTPWAKKAGRMLQFQLHPEFELPPANNEVVELKSDLYRYRVKTASAPRDEVVPIYLTYADWTARLNAVLHPRSFLPNPRVRMNEILREQNKLPVTVDLQVDADSKLHLKAEHEFSWSLTDKDRELIHHWEQTLRSGDKVRVVPFRQFQQQLLAQSGPNTAR